MEFFLSNPPIDLLRIYNNALLFRLLFVTFLKNILSCLTNYVIVRNTKYYDPDDSQPDDFEIYMRVGFSIFLRTLHLVRGSMKFQTFHSANGL